MEPVVQEGVHHHGGRARGGGGPRHELLLAHDPAGPSAALACQALYVKSVLHELRHLPDLLVKLFEMWHHAQLRVHPEDLQGAPVRILGLFTRAVAPGVVRAGAKLVVALRRTGDHVDDEVVAGEELLLGERGLAGHLEDLLPLRLREVHLAVQCAAVQQQHRRLRWVQLSEGLEGLLLGDLVVQEEALHPDLRKGARPLRLKAIAVREEVRGVLWYCQDLEAPGAEAVPKEGQR
mmetsp:Transcript_131277/g.365891  ORF Transcript_131277/g.365891 Transcript_131277/m.365891 type:complete len:235 (+) Transcript_131277:708-1412(+)